MKPVHRLLSRFRNQPRWELAYTLGVVILAVAIPTAGLLYYMNRSIKSERQQLMGDLMAGRQRSLDSAIIGIRAALQKRIEIPATDGQAPKERFATAISAGQAVAALVLANDGEIIFPVLAQAEGIDWEAEEETYEFLNDHLDAMVSSGQFADAEAMLKLNDQFNRKRFQESKLPGGRLVWPLTLLSALQELPTSHPRRAEMVGQLTQLIEDSKVPMPTGQRLNLAHQLRKIGAEIRLPYEKELATSLHLAGFQTGANREGEFVTVPADPTLFAIRPLQQNLILFLKKEPLLAEITSQTNATLASMSMTAALHLHGELKADPQLITTRAIGNLLPGWDLTAFGADASVEITQRLNRLQFIHRISAILGCLVIGALATWAIRRFTASAKLTQAKHDFLSIVSHELKTPLTSIRIFVDSLADGGLADPERAATYLNFIRGENERLSRLVENFLTFSRIEGDRMTFDFHVVHPEDVAEEVKNAATERCLHSGCRFIYTADPELPLINADTSALTTVLVNLIDNSIKYSREDKEIQFRVSKEGSSVLFTVTDNGIGMSEQTIRRLGEKFYRDRAAVRSGRGGFGLGLHIVHSIVAAHDGKVRIESTPGVGTRIIVAIPGTLETNL